MARKFARSEARNMKPSAKITTAKTMDVAVAENVKVPVIEVAAEATQITKSAVETAEVVILPRGTVTPSSCVKALEKAIGFGKSALYLEVSVSLAVFASSSTGADRATKRSVMEIYAKAGFDTLSPEGRDYKTVNRRINASAALFGKLGSDAVLSAMRGQSDARAIENLSNHLREEFNFAGINSVLEYVGKPVEQTNTSEYRAARAAAEVAREVAQRPAEADDVVTAMAVNDRIEARREERKAMVQSPLIDDGIIVSAGAMSIVVPRDALPDAIRAMARKLEDFADRLEAEIGTPEDQRNREMHS